MAESLDDTEREANARLDDLLQRQEADARVYREESNRLAAAMQSTTRNSSLALSSFQQWIARLAGFDEVAAELSSAGRPAFGNRLTFTRNDWVAASRIMGQMVASSQATDRAVQGIMGAAQTEAIGTMQRMSASMQKAFDDANAAWLRRRH
jgi:hypothetical protein